MMTVLTRERFLGICRFERLGDLCLLARLNAFWPQTLREWIEQGAPEQILDVRFRSNYFGFDYTMRDLGNEVKTGAYHKGIDIGGGVIYSHGIHLIVPPYESRIIKKDEHTVTLINLAGQKVMVDRFLPWEKMPMHLDWPVKDRATWNEFKKRLDPNTPKRWPSDWDAYVQEVNSGVEPTVLRVGSFFGVLRQWVGLENVLYMFYDDPNLIEDMMDQICYLETECIKRVLKEIRVDLAWFWEDMCYKAGPLISPAMVRKFMMPRYKKITDLLHNYGVDAIFLDSDGNVNELIPLWLEVGINGHWPLEVAAHNDAVALRKKYGKEIIMSGNIDKRVLYKGKDAIREEVMAKVPFLLEKGGYFPCVDHLVPAGVPWENYCYLINTLREVAGLKRLVPVPEERRRTPGAKRAVARMSDEEEKRK